MEKSINEKEQCVQTDVMQSVLFEDDLVTYETALLAREKGFDIDCGWKLRKLDDGTFTHTNCSDLGVEQPTQSLLQKWLREVNKIMVTISDYNFGEGFHPSVCKKYDNDHFVGHFGRYSTYEEALEIGLQEALKLI